MKFRRLLRNFREHFDSRIMEKLGTGDKRVWLKISELFVVLQPVTIHKIPTILSIKTKLSMVFQFRYIISIMFNQSDAHETKKDDEHKLTKTFLNIPF